MATVVSFDCRFWESKPGFGVPPSTLLLSFVTLTSAPPITADAAVAVTNTSATANTSRTVLRISSPPPSAGAPSSGSVRP